MKRHGNLWKDVIAFENLLTASRKAQRGKRFRDNVLSFNYNLEKELFQLQAELQSKTYNPGLYTTFRIFEPKPRLISAAPYRDRVVHHALCNIIAPIFERTFIHDSYANRVGFGSHRALRRFTSFARSSRYILQCDIRKYFPSIDHEILRSLVRRKIKCRDTLWLIDNIIDASNPQEPVIDYFPGDDLLMPLERRRGLPIGNLTSQFFANVYLNSLDHFVKEQIKATKYVRYVDDFALFSDDREFLENARREIEEHLASLRLKLHPVKSQLFQTKHGANFVGFRILPNRIRVRNDNLRLARRRLRKMVLDYREGKITQQEVSQSIRSWIGHLKHGDTWRLRQEIFSSLVFSKKP
ncbi:RNA-directed DNA polymerase [Aetokthonos hydrillicola Thurmond2011]|jgi:retron-type reverse transcriptase|uniref:RNA-directed DNA polymerase n=1 Tax=Aetokthonos hydrillicola Thurmond2011 TaxID=2712845 RepID=A0AAP5I2U8_9CYAN|nr:RNA-directed DNA polymerase [Aetokthonos hydrillicola]MBO3457467.1 RNA-directed DNA polymerase [Aetokthonos hydrillicola CCALA 1050]MBW4586012.1 RNA-directed DNA polymerase [Aetokthonos hydrillicola CCALA 1050]MDR9893759.1 RNA-directed DNA polymerase [Aetokthonos hydrillicola Thurmond2011]